MAAIWIVRSVTDNPNYKKGSLEPYTNMHVESFDNEKDATGAYNARVTAGLAKGANYGDVALEKSEVGSNPPRRIHTIIKRHSF